MHCIISVGWHCWFYSQHDANDGGMNKNRAINRALPKDGGRLISVPMMKPIVTSAGIGSIAMLATPSGSLPKPKHENPCLPNDIEDYSRHILWKCGKLTDDEFKRDSATYRKRLVLFTVWRWGLIRRKYNSLPS